MVEKQDRIEELRQELEELRASLPAHSVPASQLMRLEDLEEQLREIAGEDRDAPA